jgi:hypothetical protein
MPLTISLIRHAEKQYDDGPPFGVLADGSRDPYSLTPRGWQRAGALVSLFVPRPGQAGAPLLPTPTHLFASEIGPHSHSRRPSETLQPISDRLGVRIAEPVLQDALDALVAAIRACDGHVLVAWEHKRIPLIVDRLLGGPSATPQTWPDDRFDLIWLVEPDGDGRLQLRQVPQLLLAGDRADPIV